MNAAKKEMLDRLNSVPDDLQDSQEILDQLALMTRIDENRAQLAQTGGIPHEEAMRIMDKFMDDYRVAHE